MLPPPQSSTSVTQLSSSFTTLDNFTDMKIVTRKVEFFLILLCLITKYILNVWPSPIQ